MEELEVKEQVTPCPEEQAPEKAGKNRLVILIAAIILGVLIGWIGGRLIVEGMRQQSVIQEQTFTEAGMSITLTKAFEKTETEGYTLGYESDRVVLLALKEEFSMLPGFGKMTVEEYARLVMDNNGIEGELKTQDQFVYCRRSYESPDNGTFIHILAFYKTGDAFWMLQFMTPEAVAEIYEPQILSWCTSVTFDD